jgi:hypothetical protein
MGKAFMSSNEFELDFSKKEPLLSLIVSKVKKENNY